MGSPILALALALPLESVGLSLLRNGDHLRITVTRHF
jgi:hypothetical protein